MTRDTSAIAEGTYIPSHITAKSGAHATLRIIESVREFLGLVDQFVRQMQKKDLSKKIDSPARPGSRDGLVKLEKLLTKFHIVSQQLRERHDNRATLVIKDEYDVQDLLHALLRIEFEDVRSEEWTPRYAGSSTRMDFLLKQEKIVVEIKKASTTLREQKIGEQLILDIAHYKNHPDCKTLFCFIYDPDSTIRNRRGLIDDLEGGTNGLTVRVIIEP